MVQPVFCIVELGLASLNCIAYWYHLIKNEGIGEHVTAGGGKKINLLQHIKLQLVKPARKKRANITRSPGDPKFAKPSLAGLDMALHLAELLKLTIRVRVKLRADVLHPGKRNNE